MSGRLLGKNIIITGAAGYVLYHLLAKSISTDSCRSGIGLEASILMLREGASVLMTDINQEVLTKAHLLVCKLVKDFPGRLEAQVVDVSKESDVEQAVARLDSWGGLDVIFNNAGIMHPKDGDAEECPVDIWEKTFDINVKGVWYGSKHAIRSLRQHGKKKGSIINTASMVAIVGSATPQVAYTASKGAVIALTRELAIVHAREGEWFKIVLRSNCMVNKLTLPPNQGTVSIPSAPRH